MNNLIAFTGYSRVGKDEAAKLLVNEHGYTRLNFGDIIKQQIDPIVRKHMGFSAFTEDTEEKKKIRRTLESWGEDNYDSIFNIYFGILGHYMQKRMLTVNTRLCRSREAIEWHERGGIIVEIVNRRVKPCTPWDIETMEELHSGGHIDLHVVNESDVPTLHGCLLHALKDT
jgi:hypothetical protein